MSCMKTRHSYRRPKYRVIVEFCDNSPEAMDAFADAIEKIIYREKKNKPQE